MKKGFAGCGNSLDGLRKPGDKLEKMAPLPRKVKIPGKKTVWPGEGPALPKK